MRSQVSFTYQALNFKGEAISGKIDAFNEADAIISLRNMGMYPTKINKSADIVEERPKHPDRVYVTEKWKPGNWTIFFFGALIGSILTYVTILSLY